MPNTVRYFYEFGHFRLDANRHRLLRDGEVVPLSPKAIEALLVLVRKPGKLLEREELMQAVWADTFVEDANLTVAISHLRKALGQNGETAEYIETVPRVGYRFVAEVREVRQQAAPLIVEKRTSSRTVIEEELIHDEADVPVVQTAMARGLPRFVSRTTTALLLGALALSALALSAVVFLKSDPRGSTPDLAVIKSIRSVAVLPPRDLSGSADNASLSLGIADALIGRLAGTQRVTVRPTSAVVRYEGSTQDPVTVGQALAVDAVLEGTLQRDRGRTRVNLQLFETKNGNQLWTGKFDESDTDLFKLQDSVSQEVAQALFPSLSQKEKTGLARRETTNAEAYALYLKGNYFWSKRGPEAAKSIDYFRKAIELDPNFAQAYAALAAVDATGASPSPEADALIEKALQLDDTLAEAHATLAFIKMFHYWDWSTAERELDRAIELNPNSSVAHHWKGVYLSLRGRLDEAKAEMHRALDLDPLSLIIMADIGQLHYFAHEYDQAIDYCNRALAFDPDFWVAHEYLVDIYWAKGMNESVLNELLNLDYRSSTAEGKQHVRQVFARGGLRAVVEQQIGSSANVKPVASIRMAKLYSRVGDNEHALYWLDRAVNGQKFFWTAYINVDPIYDPLRSDPRFKEIIHRMGLPEHS